MTLYVTYLYPTILGIYTVLGTFSVELQSKKHMHLKIDYKLHDHAAYSPKLAVFLFVL